ncbi:MAG: hypothetical protein RID53_17435 [Coleofasciculus sp. B1-GNL1-01]
MADGRWQMADGRRFPGKSYVETCHGTSELGITLPALVNGWENFALKV